MSGNDNESNEITNEVVKIKFIEFAEDSSRRQQITSLIHTIIMVLLLMMTIIGFLIIFSALPNLIPSLSG